MIDVGLRDARPLSTPRAMGTVAADAQATAA
jgi:hypothetical protein